MRPWKTQNRIHSAQNHAKILARTTHRKGEGKRVNKFETFSLAFVVDVVTLTHHRRNLSRVGGHRTGSKHSGVEEYLLGNNEAKENTHS